MDNDREQVLALFRERRRFLLTTHVNPDGDAIGSEIALAHCLAAAGKEVAIVNHSPTPRVYRFLDPAGEIRTFDPARDAPLVRDAEVIVLLDANQPERLRSMREAVLASPALRVCIDHHLEPGDVAQLAVIDPEATSTGEILYHLLLDLAGPELPRRAAEALYVAIMTDTGSFRYPRVDPETFRIAARLLERGADPVALYSVVYERWSPGRLRLLGEMLAGLETGAGGRIAHVTVTRDMLRRTGTEPEDTDNFTTYPMSLDGVAAGILFLETGEGVKISFRSRGDIPVNELAKEFGGNGHLNAAGANVAGVPLAELRATVLRAAERYLTTTGHRP